MSIKLFTINPSELVKKIEKKVIYSPSDFGIDNKYSGKNVSIAIIGSGLPAHNYPNNIDDFEVMTEKTDSPDDEYGCTSILLGFLISDNKNIKGLCPDSSLYIAKSFDDKGEGDLASITTSVLWSIVKNVDLIVFPFSSDRDFKPFYNAICKCKDNNIIMLCSKNSGYISKYKEIISVNNIVGEDDKISVWYDKNLNVKIPKSGVCSHCNNKKYFVGTSEYASLGMAAGVVSLLIEKAKELKIKNIKSFIKKSLNNKIKF